MKHALYLVTACLLAFLPTITIAQPPIQKICLSPADGADQFDFKKYSSAKPEDLSSYTVHAGTKYIPYGGAEVITVPHYVRMDQSGGIDKSVEYLIDNQGIQYRTVDIATGTKPGGGNVHYIICHGRPFRPTYHFFPFPYPVPPITPNNETDRILVIAIDDNGDVLQSVEITNIDGTAQSPQQGYNLFPISSLYSDISGNPFLYICGYVQSGYVSGGPYIGNPQPDFYTPKKAFAICIEANPNQGPFGNIAGVRTFDSPTSPPTEPYWQKDYDIAMRIKKINYDPLNIGKIFVTGSANAQTGIPTATNIIRSATMGWILPERLIGGPGYQVSVIATGNGDGGGDNEYGIDMIEDPSGRKYVISNKFDDWNEGVYENDYMHGMDAKPYMWGVTEYDDIWNSNGTRVWVNNGGWALQAMPTDPQPASGNFSITIAGMTDFRQAIYNPNENIIPFLMNAEITNPWTSNLNLTLSNESFYNTSNGTGDPFSVLNSYYAMGGGTDNMAYGPRFATRENVNNNIVMTAPRMGGGKLALKYLQTASNSDYAIPCSTFYRPSQILQDVWTLILSIEGTMDVQTQAPAIIWQPLPFDNFDCTEAHYRQTSINENYIEKVAIHPNPASDVLNVTGADRADYIVKDITGRILQSGQFDANNAISLETLPTGMYLLQLKVAGKQEVLKFTKQ